MMNRKRHFYYAGIIPGKCVPTTDSWLLRQTNRLMVKPLTIIGRAISQTFPQVWMRPVHDLSPSEAEYFKGQWSCFMWYFMFIPTVYAITNRYLLTVKTRKWCREVARNLGTGGGNGDATQILLPLGTAISGEFGRNYWPLLSLPVLYHL